MPVGPCKVHGMTNSLQVSPDLYDAVQAGDQALADQYVRVDWSLDGLVIGCFFLSPMEAKKWGVTKDTAFELPKSFDEPWEIESEDRGTELPTAPEEQVPLADALYFCCSKCFEQWTIRSSKFQP